MELHSSCRETDNEHLIKSINKIQMKSFQVMISGMKENLGDFTQDSTEETPVRMVRAGLGLRWRQPREDLGEVFQAEATSPETGWASAFS